MLKLIDQLRRSRSGATSVEYAALATCVALAIVVAVSFVGTQVNASYTAISASFQ
jgi:Flp pilus assembly pilin Flp